MVQAGLHGGSECCRASPPAPSRGTGRLGAQEVRGQSGGGRQEGGREAARAEVLREAGREGQRAVGVGVVLIDAGPKETGAGAGEHKPFPHLCNRANFLALRRTKDKEHPAPCQVCTHQLGDPWPWILDAQ